APGYWQAVDAIAISRDGRSLAAYLERKHRKAWDLETHESISFEPDRYNWCERLSPDGDLYSIGGWPGPGVRIRRFPSGELVSFCFHDSLPAVTSSFADEGRLWATA